MQLLRISKEDKCLIIAPHPDDESIGCGGLILKYAQQCDVICLTDGRQGQGDVKPVELASIRMIEFDSAMRYAHVNNHKMLGLADGTLCRHTDGMQCFDISKYSKVFITGMEDHHPDHSAVPVILKNSWKACGMPDVEIYQYEVHAQNLHNTHFLDITDCVEKKRELINIYRSQIKNFPFDDKILEINRSHGKKRGYTEAYRKIDVNEIDDDLYFEGELEKIREYYWVFVRWMKLEIEKKSIAELLKSKCFNKVLIYGYKEFGQLLYSELKKTNIKVPCIIDKNYENIKEHFDGSTICIAPDMIQNEFKDIPLIVTATWYIEEIEEELRSMGYSCIVSFKDLIEEAM